MKKFLVFIILIATEFGWSQVNIPEPYKITSMVDFTEIPTGSATGLPDVKIPLYQISTLGDLTVDLTLQYNLNGGINTSMIGNQFGDSWNLSFLGTISRRCGKVNPIAGQNYIVDDQRFFSQSGNANVEGNDKYTFNVLGLEGKFTLSKVNNQIVATLNQNSDFVSIHVDYDSSVPTFNSITIKDKNGVSYIFEHEGVLDSNKFYYGVPSTDLGLPTLNFDFTNPNFDPDKYTTMEGYGPAFLKSWYLSKIVDRHGRNLVSVDYEKTVIIPDFTSVSFIKKINVINKGSIEFSSVYGNNNGVLVNSYTTALQVKDLKGTVLKTIEFYYTNRLLSGRSKLYLNQIRHFNQGKTKFENYILDYKNSSISHTEATVDLEGFLKAKNCFGSYERFRDIATHLSLQKITYPTGGVTLYQFDPNTHSSTTYQQYNNFNTTALFITPTYNSATNRYSFNIPAGYEKMYTKVSSNSSYTLYQSGQPLQYLYTDYNKKFEDLCRENTYLLNPYTLNGASGNFYIQGASNATINVMVTKLKDEAGMEKFEYSGGLRIKRIAYFPSYIVQTYLENNPVAERAEKEIIYDYSENFDQKYSSGRKQLVTDPLSDSFMEKKVLYEKVTVTNRGIGKAENYFNNVALNDFNWYRKNMLLKSSTTYDNNSTILQNTVYNRQYTTVGTQSVITQEQISKKEYEQGGYLETGIVSNYDTTYRNLTDTEHTDHLAKVTKAIFDYQTINNVRVNTLTRNYIDNSLTDQVLKTYGSLADLLKTEFKIPEMSSYEKVGNENTKYINGLLRGYTQPDGTPVTLVYGYLDTQIIAKMVNVDANIYYDSSSYQTIRSNLEVYSTQWHANYSEANLKTALNSLRTAFPNAMVTTYTYKPMIGVSSITDENGKTTTYEYDTFNRLTTIKDYLGNILNEYQYNFTN
ncbi:MAG: RHS repeat domain-containing protein [Myroides sp.]